VLEEKATYTKAGISSVPTIILNDQYLLQGAQPSESFVEAFEQLIQKS
jgi:predicted DsbA family dithiol-disulfide isomerase